MSCFTVKLKGTHRTDTHTHLKLTVFPLSPCYFLDFLPVRHAGHRRWYRSLFSSTSSLWTEKEFNGQINVSTSIDQQLIGQLRLTFAPSWKVCNSWDSPSSCWCRLPTLLLLTLDPWISTCLFSFSSASLLWHSSCRCSSSNTNTFLVSWLFQLGYRMYFTRSLTFTKKNPK